jgi:preprotein translocase subunit YajC
MTLPLFAAPAPAEPHPLLQLLPILLIFGIFYFVLIMPMRKRQRKAETMQKQLKAGDRVIIQPGIFGQVVGAEGDTLVVRIGEQTKVKVLRSAIAALQGESAETEKK